MKRFRFKKIDAFTFGESSGNPAGYIILPDADHATEQEMQQIAYELRGFVSEVAYVSPSPDPAVDYIFRYYSCEREVVLCAHATVAIGYDLAKEHAGNRATPFFTIETKKGILRIENRLQAENLVYLQAPEPVFWDTSPDVTLTASALSLSPDDIDASRSMAIVNAGLNSLLVPLRDKDVCINCSPEYQALRDFSCANAIDVIVIYAADTVFPDADYRTRVFAASFGYLEDPATGSGNAAFGYYLIRQGLWTDRTLYIEQGPERNRPNRIVLQKMGDGRIHIGGAAVTRIDGEYILYSS